MTFGVLEAEAAEKSQSICKSGDLVRRVVVEVGDAGTGLPCEVVYWKDTEAPGERRVLWNARSDAAFCDGKAAGLVDRLATAGWNCTGGGDLPATTTAAVAPAAPAPAPSPAPAPAPAVIPAPTIAANTEASDVDAAAVGRVVAAAPAAPVPAPAPAPSSQTETAALAPAPAPAPAAPATTATGTDNLETAALTAPAIPPDPALADQLQSVIQTNLESLNQSVDGDFQAQIGDFGDLNNDGFDDAVVFFNYESSAADFTQFVAAYLFNGEGYHLAATKPVGGTDLAVREVQVEGINNGLIQLRLVLNDASQTDNRRAAMILKDGQLIETQ